MDLNYVHNLLKTTGYPVAYRAFKTAQTLPFICYLVAYSNTIPADGEVYLKNDIVQIELYTANKDIAAEEKLEAVLSSLFYTKTEDYIDTEKIYKITYEIEV